VQRVTKEKEERNERKLIEYHELFVSFFIRFGSVFGMFEEKRRREKKRPTKAAK